MTIEIVDIQRRWCDSLDYALERCIGIRRVYLLSCVLLAPFRYCRCR